MKWLGISILFAFGIFGFSVIGQDADKGVIQDTNLTVAMGHYQSRNYFMAEAVLMGDSLYDNVELKSLLLVHTAAKIGNLEEKVTFFSGYLDQSQSQRQVALLFRSYAFAYLRDWEAFRGQAVSALLEVDEFPYHTDLLLLYCLARYTSQSRDAFSLTPCQEKWFDAARTLPGEKVLPLPISCDTLPGFILDLAHLGTTLEKPRTGHSGTEDAVVQRLAVISNSLESGELFKAADQLNAIEKSDLVVFPWDFTINYYHLLARFYDLNKEPEKLQKTEERLKNLKKEFAVNFECFQDQVKPKVVLTPGKVEIHAPRRVQSFPELEEALPFLENEAFIKQMNGIEAEGPYGMIYKNYLLGRYNLIHGRYQSAYSSLSKAETQVSTTPFAVLESKILATMGDYYLTERNEDQANWYWIASAQSLSSPEALCQMAETQIESHPFDAMIDSFLVKPVEDQLSAILYAHQMRELLVERVNVYRQAHLSNNKVISNQILEIGHQMQSEIEKLKKASKQNYSTRALMELKELWGQLWDKVRPEYSRFLPLNLNEIRKQLNPREIFLVMTEGREQLGSVVVTPDHAFVSYLGPAKSLADRKWKVVVQQLGKAIDFHQKTGILSLSPKFLQGSFLKKMSENNPPGSFQVLFSVGGLSHEWNAVDTDNFVLFYDSSIQDPKPLSNANIRQVNTSLVAPFDAANLDEMAKDRTFIGFTGTVKAQEEDLWLGIPPQKRSLSSLILENTYSGLVLYLGSLETLVPLLPPLDSWSDRMPYPVIFTNAQMANLSLPSHLRYHSWTILGSWSEN